MGIDLVQVVLMRHGVSRKATCPEACARRRRAACPDHKPTGLTSRAFKVLLRMAATALDKPTKEGRPPNLYFAGEGPLIGVLYGPDAVELAERADTGQKLATEDLKRLKNMRREVRAAVDELRSAGLIAPEVEHARTGHRQRFRLVLGLGAEGQVAHPAEGQIAHPAEGQVAPPRVGKSPTPRTERGPTEDSPKDATTIDAASTTDRARDDTLPDGVQFDPNEHHTATGATCECGRGFRHPLHSPRTRSAAS